MLNVSPSYLFIYDKRLSAKQKDIYHISRVESPHHNQKLNLPLANCY